MTWERRWMRRMIKGLIWAIVFIPLSHALDFEITWKLFALVITLSMLDGILDILLPTIDQQKKTS